MRRNAKYKKDEELEKDTTEIKGFIAQIFGSTSNKLLEKAKQDRVHTINHFVIYLKEEFNKEQPELYTLDRKDIMKVLDNCKKTAIERIEKAKGFTS